MTPVTRSFSILLLGLAIVVTSWWSTVEHLVNLIDSRDVFTYGKLVPFVSLALIWSRRENFLSLIPVSSLWGLLIFIGAVCVWLMGELIDSAFFSHVGFVTAIQGIVLFAFGVNIYRTILFPMLFLYLVIPFGYTIVGPLQHLTANLVIAMLDFIGANFKAEGVLIELPSGLYEVAEACAGVRFFFTSIVTSILLSNLVFKSWKKRVMIVCVGAVLPIAANALRVLTILGIAEMTDQSFAKDVDHIVYGWVFLSIVLLALISFAYKVSDNDGLNDQVVSSFKENGLRGVLLLGGVALLSLPLLATYVTPNQFAPEYREGQGEEDEMFSEAPEGFRILNDQASLPSPNFLNADIVRSNTLRFNGFVFNAYAALYNPVGPGRRLFQIENRVVTKDWLELTGRRSTHTLSCDEQVFERIYRRGDARIITWTLFRLNGETVTTTLDEKLRTAVARLKQDEVIGETVVLTAIVSGDIENIRNVYERFISLVSINNSLWNNELPQAKDKTRCAA